MANNRNNTPNAAPTSDADLQKQLKENAEKLALMEQMLKEKEAELEKKTAELEEKNSTSAPTSVKEVKKVKITIPITRTEKNDVYVAVNGRTYQIKRGVEVEVPEYVLKALKHEEKMLMSVANLEEKASRGAEQ